MIFARRCLSILTWVVNLFDPPPLDSMNRVQKVGRVFMVTMSLVLGSILAAVVTGIGIYLVQRGHEMVTSVPHLLTGLGIIFTSIVVNTICVLVLLAVKRADQKLIPRP